MVARIADVAAIQGVREAVVDGNGRDGLCRSQLHASFERGEKQRREGRKGMTGGVHRSVAQARGNAGRGCGPLLGRAAVRARMRAWAELGRLAARA